MAVFYRHVDEIARGGGGGTLHHEGTTRQVIPQSPLPTSKGHEGVKVGGRTDDQYPQNTIPGPVAQQPRPPLRGEGKGKGEGESPRLIGGLQKLCVPQIGLNLPGPLFNFKQHF